MCGCFAKRECGRLAFGSVPMLAQEARRGKPGRDRDSEVVGGRWSRPRVFLPCDSVIFQRPGKKPRYRCGHRREIPIRFPWPVEFVLFPLALATFTVEDQLAVGRLTRFGVEPPRVEP